MIAITLQPLEETRTPNNSCYYLASCIINGKTYTAKSRRNASMDLARVLVDAGIADDLVEISQIGVAGCLRYKSLYKMTKRMIEENRTASVREREWREREWPDE